MVRVRDQVHSSGELHSVRNVQPLSKHSLKASQYIFVAIAVQ